MSAGDWYLALFSLAAGVGIAGYWGARGVGADIETRFHVAAEIATSAVLVAAGLGLVVARDAAWPDRLSAFGLGMLACTLIASPGRYLQAGDRRTAALLGLGWLGLVPAIVVRFA